MLVLDWDTGVMRLTGLDPAQLMADARAAATYCITKQRTLWDTPPAEARARKP